ncbi:hypothetical protein [Massilia glaciei]|nr:hypothetical protein [Massilia glaciei]
MSFLLAGALGAGLAHAQTPALGRLFTTPSERGELDALRAADGVAQPAPPPAAVPAPPPPPLLLNGILRSSKGKSTVWINGVAQKDEQNGVSPPGTKPSLTMELGTGKRVRLKPGQRYDPAQDGFKDVDEP